MDVHSKQHGDRKQSCLSYSQGIVVDRRFLNAIHNAIHVCTFSQQAHLDLDVLPQRDAVGGAHHMTDVLRGERAHPDQFAAVAPPEVIIVADDQAYILSL